MYHTHDQLFISYWRLLFVWLKLLIFETIKFIIHRYIQMYSKKNYYSILSHNTTIRHTIFFSSNTLIHPLNENEEIQDQYKLVFYLARMFVRGKDKFFSTSNHGMNHVSFIQWIWDLLSMYRSTVMWFEFSRSVGQILILTQKSRHGCIWYVYIVKYRWLSCTAYRLFRFYSTFIGFFSQFSQILFLRNIQYLENFPTEYTIRDELTST